MDIYCRCGEPWSCRGIHHTTSDLSIHSWRELLRGAGCHCCEGNFQPDQYNDAKWCNSVNMAAEEYVDCTFPKVAYIQPFHEDAPLVDFLEVYEAFNMNPMALRLISKTELRLIDNVMYAWFEDPRDHGATYDKETEIRQEAENEAWDGYLANLEEIEGGYGIKIATIPSIYHHNHGPASLADYMNMVVFWEPDFADRIALAKSIGEHNVPDEVLYESEDNYAKKYGEEVTEVHEGIAQDAHNWLQEQELSSAIMSGLGASDISQGEGLDAYFSPNDLLAYLSKHNRPVGWTCYMNNNHYVFVPHGSPCDPVEWGYGRDETKLGGMTFLLKGKEVHDLGWCEYPVVEFEDDKMRLKTVPWRDIPQNIQTNLWNFLTAER